MTITDSRDSTLPGAPPRRLWFADNLRILLTSLVVLHHLAVTYSGLPLWYYTDPGGAGTQIGFTSFLLVDQAWFMGAFFLLSGYFTPGSYDRKGPRAFLRERLIRLGIPLVVFYFVLNPLLSFGHYHGDALLEDYLHTIGSGPLWFVLALLVFDAAYVLFRHLTRNRRARTRRPLTVPMVAGFVVVLALLTYLLRILLPIGSWVPIADFPTSAYLPQYIGFFAMGIVAYRNGWFQSITARMGWTGLGMALGACAVFLPLALSAGTEAMNGNGTLGSLCYALWDSTFAVGVVLALLALFGRTFDAQGRFGRYLSGHAFTVYVIHALVVTAAGYALSALDLPALAKFAIGAVLVLPACFLLAGPIRRLPGVRRVL
ncbi:acyltransferase family protein [Sciscionella marina]|uniref:acyltransferase family protein n=1 Tax=Sciscionella marina TaxID=508770 RepID=UPI00036B5142|nr:acyltransferase family protein [Sciscionella marina]